MSTAAVLLCLAGAVARPQNPSPHRTSAQPSGLMAEAQSDLARGDPKKAIEMLSSHLQAHPEDISARLALGHAYSVAGQANQAKAEFQMVLKDAPGNGRALAALGEIYAGEGQFDQAEPMLGSAAKASNAPRIRILWAVALVRLHRYKEAQYALAGLAPPSKPGERIPFHRLKASIASGLGNASAAASDMEKALALQPQDAGLAMATAVAELQSKNWNRAASLAQALYLRAGDPQAGLVLLEARLGMHRDLKETLQLFRTTNLKPGEELAFRQRLAEVLISHGEFAASIEQLTRAVQLDLTRSDLLYNLALAQFQAGRLDRALESAETCRALDDTADLEDLLGDIQEARGDNLAAVKSYQAAITLAPNEEKYRLSLAVEFIRHQTFDGARTVLKQAEVAWPGSWRIQLALGLVEHLAGSDEEASRILIHAAELAPEPETALRYLGKIQMDQASAPVPPAIAQVCGYSDRHPNEGNLQYYCAALLFRRDYVLADKMHAGEILRRLRTAARLLAKDAAPHCQIAKVSRWIDRWQDALRESETCVRMDPNSADGHYRLAQIYQHLGQPERSQQEMALFDAASKRVADENARRDETIKVFLYTLKEGSLDSK